MRFRGKSIRRKIVALLLVPLVALTSIWTFATVITSREADQLLEVSAVLEELGGPVQETVRTVQRERRRALVHLADPRSADSLPALREGQRATDAAVAALRRHAAGERVRDGLAEDSRGRLDDLLEDLDRLRRLRAQVLENTAERRDAYEAYSAVVDSCHGFVATLRAVDDTRLDREGRAVIGLSLAREHLAREDALLAAALAAGRMTGEELRAFSDRVAERELTYRTHLPMLPADDRDEHRAFWSGSDGRTLRAAEDRIIAAGAPAAAGAVNAERWRKNVTGVLEELRRLEGKAVDRHHRRVAPEATAVLVRAGVAGILGFAAVLLSVIVSFRVGRGLIRDLGALRREANEAAGVRLPGVMRRLAAGERIDAGTEVPRLAYGRDEMGQVGQALNTLQRAAVEAAVKQADMRRGVSEVFVNLARRSQVLLHRQLTLLDAMERRTDDPEVLSDLFRLDHLTTRMRRHAEGLVILSGAAPSRQWRRPVPLMDVVRAAVSEVEDYDRVEVRRLPRLAVDGAAIADLTHLVAELLENATVFSPPHTAVQVLGERVPSGFALEIHDRGLGMPPEALLEANLRLAETSDFQLSDTDRLGLFVVSRLARRRGVRVSLQPSPYGGTTAVVLIPGALLTAPERAGRGGDAPGTGELRAGDAGSTPRTAAGLPLRGARPVLGTARDGPVELEAGRFPPRSSPDTEHGRPAGAGAAPGEPDPATAGGLPGRVRQESPVREPGSRPRPRPRQWADGAREGGERRRDAAEVRDRMGSLQRGLRHGRRRNAGLPDGTGPDGRGTRTGDPGGVPVNGAGANGTGGADRTGNDAPGTTHWREAADDRTARHGGRHRPQDG
ncbi:histidine kinase [Streptomyces carminius]|uniref:histidine kinase n=1 Tax=Streptomyces carminius TaxID=2665496 RepID=A0A2M8M548_9ACTN|nr:nitrate- and nitrite sensing domain-containing protein [Streptomyces carminius]PJE99341.1 histidine kinase [Streptomyces carminius]